MIKQIRTFTKIKRGEYSSLFQEVAPPNTPLIVGKLSLQNWCADGAEEITVTVEVTEAAKPLPRATKWNGFGSCPICHHPHWPGFGCDGKPEVKGVTP